EPHADALIGRIRLGAPVAGWTVLALQVRAEALAPIHRMRRRLFGALALVLTAGTMAATILARRMTQPLQSLTEAGRGPPRGRSLGAEGPGTAERGDKEHRTAELVDKEQRTAELVDMIVGEVDRLERVVAALTELGRPHEPSIEETLLGPLLTRAIEFVGGQ